MTIDRLRDVLTAIGPPDAPPNARDVSEVLWLACHIASTEEPVPGPAPPDAPQAPAGARENLGPEPPAVAPTPAEQVAEPRAALHPRPAAPAAEPATGTEPVGEAAEILVPTAPMLADPLGVQRALRPLKRRVPSSRRRELDEEATAARIAHTGVWTPVLVPAPERWLTLSLVVDSGPTMRLWRPLARELAETLLRQGAFQDVHVSHLDTTGRVAATPGAPPEDPGALLPASGRHAVLVLSDCSGPHWWNGRATRAVRRWARTAPTAILQPLAERLWRRTAAPAAPGRAALPRPGAPNTDLLFSPYDGAPPDGVPVPVLEVAPRWLGAWALLVAGAGPQPAAIASLPSRPPGTAPVAREQDLPVADRVRRFLATASPGAAELAAHVAVSVPSLPVMRLIQHRVLDGTGPGQLAEVLLSGLLRPDGGARYAFVPGAREALLDTLPRPEAQHTRHVLEAVSTEIERRAGTMADTFRALLPADGGPVRLTADTDHFALVTPETLTTLAPSQAGRDRLEPRPPSGPPDLLALLDTPVDELTGPDWYRPPHPTIVGVDESGDPVWLDILRGGPPTGHGTITGPRESRDRVLRTIIMSLALSHSPHTVAFAFVDSSGGASFVGLGALPHVAAAVHGLFPDSSVLGELPRVLRAEQRRRASVLADAGFSIWPEYQAAIARGRVLDPLPALIIVLDGTGPLLDARPDLLRPLVDLASDEDVGIRFIFCSPPESSVPQPLLDLAAWVIRTPGREAGGEYVLAAARAEPPGGEVRFRPAHIALNDSDPLVQAMLQRGLRATKLPWPTSPAPAPPQPAPAAAPRQVVIGTTRDGRPVHLDPLDPSADVPHGLIVGEGEARQRAVRSVVRALTIAYSPAELGIVFAGLGEHPLGRDVDIPHRRHSYEELLGDPGSLRSFLDVVAEELAAREHAGRSEPPSGRLLVVVDLSLTFPASRPVIGTALLALAQRGEAMGIHLLLSSSTAERTTIWARFLPMLRWRIAASPLPPAVTQDVMGRPRLDFPTARTARAAHLRIRNASPTSFELPDEPAEAWDDEGTAVLTRLLWELEQGKEKRTIARPLRGLIKVEHEAFRTGQSPGPRHLVLYGPIESDMRRLARLYGRMLSELGVLPRPDVTELSWHAMVARHGAGSAASEIGETLRTAGGGILLLHGADGIASDIEGLGPSRRESALVFSLIELFEEHADDTVVILSGERPGLDRLLGDHPRLRRLFPRALVLSPGRSDRRGSDLPDELHVDELPAVTDRGIPIGIANGSHEPVRVAPDIGPPLLVIGSPGVGRTNLVHLILNGMAQQADPDTAVYVFDPRGSLRGLATEFGLDSPVPPGVRYTESTGVFADLLAEAVARLPAASLVVAIDRGPPLDGDPLERLVPDLRALHDGNLRLLVVRRPRLPGEMPDPVVTALHDLGAAALFMGVCDGQEADLFAARLPDEPLPVGRALLVQGDAQQLVQTAHAAPGGDGR